MLNNHLCSKNRASNSLKHFQCIFVLLYRFAKSGKRLRLLPEIKFLKTQSNQILICLTSRYFELTISKFVGIYKCIVNRLPVESPVSYFSSKVAITA